MNGWISTRDLDARGLRLFCLPHAGAGAAAFYQWKRLVAGRIAVCPVMLPGRESRLPEPALRSVDAVVANLQAAVLNALDRPYAIFGHSMGALLAFAWAQQIARAGSRKPEALIVSGRNAPHLLAPHRDLYRSEDDTLQAELKKLYGESHAAVLDDEEMRKLFVPILRADIQVVETYEFNGEPKLSCPILALAGTRDRSVSDDGLSAWAEHTSAATTTGRIEGDHFYTLDAAPSGGRTQMLDLLLHALKV